MRKFLISLFSIFMLTGCFGKITTYEEIDFQKLDQMINQKENFILFIGSSECSHCQSYKPKLDAVIKVNQIKVYYIDVSKLTKKQDEKLEGYIPYGGTPYTVFVEKGSVKKVNGMVYAIEGDRDIDYIEKIMKKNGYM